MFFILMLLANSVAAVSPEADNSNNSDVLIAHGVLSRYGKAGNLWTLKPEPFSLKFRGETIVEVTFMTKAGPATRIYGPFEEKFVELVGEVKSVFHGNAALNQVRSIGVVESASLSARLNAAAAISATGVSASNPINRTPYKHAYYLFLADPPTGCQACYVPLLITQSSLEEIASGGDTQLCVFMFTYERDSIWEIKGAVPVDVTSIELHPRIIHVNGRSYRYQEISPSDVLKLLQEPMGTIPISRPGIMNKAVAGASMDELIGDFRSLLDGGVIDHRN